MSGAVRSPPLSPGDTAVSVLTQQTSGCQDQLPSAAAHGRPPRTVHPVIHDWQCQGSTMQPAHASPAHALRSVRLGTRSRNLTRQKEPRVPAVTAGGRGEKRVPEARGTSGGWRATNQRTWTEGHGSPRGLGTSARGHDGTTRNQRSLQGTHTQPHRAFTHLRGGETSAGHACRDTRHSWPNPHPRGEQGPIDVPWVLPPASRPDQHRDPWPHTPGASYPQVPQHSANHPLPPGYGRTTPPAPCTVQQEPVTRLPQSRPTTGAPVQPQGRPASPHPLSGTPCVLPWPPEGWPLRPHSPCPSWMTAAKSGW